MALSTPSPQADTVASRGIYAGLTWHNDQRPGLVWSGLRQTTKIDLSTHGCSFRRGRDRDQKHSLTETGDDVVGPVLVAGLHRAKQIEEVEQLLPHLLGEQLLLPRFQIEPEPAAASLHVLADDLRQEVEPLLGHPGRNVST